MELNIAEVEGWVWVAIAGKDASNTFPHLLDHLNSQAVEVFLWRNVGVEAVLLSFIIAGSRSEWSRQEAENELLVTWPGESLELAGEVDSQVGSKAGVADDASSLEELKENSVVFLEVWWVLSVAGVDVWLDENVLVNVVEDVSLLARWHRGGGGLVGLLGLLAGLSVDEESHWVRGSWDRLEAVRGATVWTKVEDASLWLGVLPDQDTDLWWELIELVEGLSSGSGWCQYLWCFG